MKSVILERNNVIASKVTAPAAANKVISLSSSKQDFISAEMSTLKEVSKYVDLIVMTEDKNSFASLITQSKRGRQDSVSYVVESDELMALVRSIECLVMSRSFLAGSGQSSWSQVLVVFDTTSAEVWETNEEAYGRLLTVLENSTSFGVQCLFINPEVSVKSLGFGFGATKQSA